MPSNIKNIAIIAHVDHGKTSLVDQLLTQSGTMKVMEDASLIMDNNDQEKERGITIYAKNTSLIYKDITINVMDTPGHADFGSEVERALTMVDSVLLVIDAYEGPMPQTSFVLKKSLERWLNPIVVINKIDKPTARPDRVIDQTFDLFIQLGATDEQADFPIIYSSARDGYAFMDMSEFEDAKTNGSITPILDFIVDNVPDSPSNDDDNLRIQIVNLDYDKYVGRLGMWRITSGTVKPGQQVIVYNNEGEPRKAKVAKVYTTLGLQKQEVKEARSWMIVNIAGITDIYVGETIGVEGSEPFPPLHIDQPTLAMDFIVNDSPFAGREGKFVTSRNIRERLEKETETNVWLKIEIQPGGQRTTVSGRWELHLSVLIETMRREGFELQVSSPKVIMQEVDGKTHEPIENVVVTVPDDMSGSIIALLSNRKGNMTNMMAEKGITTIEFKVPTRGLLGVRAEFILLTRGEGIMYSSFSHYEQHKGPIDKRVNGSMISMASGGAMKFSIWKLQDRGTIFVKPQTELYEGMIVGESAKPGDMTVNLTKNKHLTNVRTGKADDNMLLTPINELTLEDALSYIGPDEYVEVTPENVRLRKIYLREGDRKIHSKKK